MDTDKTNFSQIYIDTIAWRLESLSKLLNVFPYAKFKENKSDRKCLAVMFLCTNLPLFLTFGFKTDRIVHVNLYGLHKQMFLFNF